MTRPENAANSRRSEELFRDARRVIPGGVNSPARAFGAVGGTPRFIESASGAVLTDADGMARVDFVLSWGAIILGHAHPDVVQAIATQASRGTSYGAPTRIETDLAARVVAMMPAVEMVRFVSSGTEAVMSALRLARAATQRSLVVKFAGCYHGHGDALLISAGSGAATLGLPDSPGVTSGSVRDTLTLEYNDVAALETLFRERGSEVAAVIVEPIAGNMGMILPVPGFLEKLRELTSRHGAVLIFDEVMTGFRVAAGGAQAIYGIRPDLTCLGKVIGGGLPAAAYGGRREIMELVAPAGPVYQAGTLSGNPLAMAAGVVTLDALMKAGCYERLQATSRALTEGLRELCEAHGVAVQTTAVGGMWGFFFSENPVRNFDMAKRSDSARFVTFFHRCLAAGAYLPPSPFEACFVSLAHTDDVVERATHCFEEALSSNAGQDIDAASPTR
jgi:glutamate-1-semialdehyde 2,1-aminomutase